MGRGKVFPAARARSLVNPLRRLVQSPTRTVAAMALPADGLVLELGSGPGFFSSSIAEAVPAGHVVLVDLQTEMLDHARRRLMHRPGISLVGADAMQLPFNAGQFDVAIVATMLGEVPDRDTCLAEVRRVLRDRGVLAVAETRRDSDFISLAQLRALVEAHGFQFAGRRGVAWQYVARFRSG
jgi:ubiquinone/menaquinone biosynthesis C-methylase UbiE